METPTEFAVRAALRDVIDPEIGLDVVALGLIYDVAIAGRDVTVRMTMTTPACPLHEDLVGGAKAAIRRHVPESGAIAVELVWDPPWAPSMMSDAARSRLGF